MCVESIGNKGMTAIDLHGILFTSEYLDTISVKKDTALITM